MALEPLFLRLRPIHPLKKAKKKDLYGSIALLFL
jgi:hypothetical protein